MTIDQYIEVRWKAVKIMQTANRTITLDKAFMSALKLIWPGEYDMLKGSYLDTFHIDNNFDKLYAVLTVLDVNKRELQPGDNVLYTDPQACMHFSVISHFTTSSVVFKTTQYVAKDKASRRIYKLNN